MHASLAGERALLLQLVGGARVDVGAGIKGFVVSRGLGAGCGVVASLEVRPRLGWRWDCESLLQRSCLGEPVHGSAVSLPSELSTFPLSQLPAVLSVAWACSSSVQTTTQKCVDVGHCPLLTRSGTASAFWGQHGPETGRASSFEAALFSVRCDVYSREGRLNSSWATRLHKRQPAMAARDRSTGMTQPRSPCTT